MPKFKLASLLVAFIVLVTLGAVLGSRYLKPGDTSDSANQETTTTADSNGSSKRSEPTSLVGQLVQSELVILALQDDLDLLSKSAKDLAFAQGSTRQLFASKLKVNSVVELPEKSTVDRFGFRHRAWQTDPTLIETTPDELSIFDPVFSSTSKFKNFKFKLVKGELNDSQDTFTGEVTLSALAVTNEGNRDAIKANLSLQWKKQLESDCDCSGWKIVEISLADLKTSQGDSQPLFKEVLDALVVDRRQLSGVRRCIHEELCVQLIKTGSAKLPVENFPFPFQYDGLTGAHPGLAVVDINNDGWDDLYVMVRWGNNRLLINQGDGTFVESASKYGLDVNSHSSAGVFADFDNDGDPDLFLGRYFDRSIYFENQDGVFKERNDLLDIPLPAMVSSVSAADYNGDGLLDIYCLTYGNKEAELEHFLEPEKFDEINDFYRDHDSHHIMLHSGGAPNQLLVNLGDGRFGSAPENSQLEFFQTSFQATWSDYDKDGDPDVYVCNDFGPDYLMRNDYPDGFTDVTEQFGHPSMKGFGMGATWGDFDLDGRQDLYVSNMYSKAGYTSNGFEQVAGLDKSSMQVAKAGWSWGGQFADFDNDGFLDLYVANGYFTAPEDVAVKIDM